MNKKVGHKPHKDVHKHTQTTAQRKVTKGLRAHSDYSTFYLFFLLLLDLVFTVQAEKVKAYF